MQATPLKQQLLNYSVLFKQMFLDYYNHQKKFFWLIQFLMIVSTITGIFWILTIILGISHYQNPTQVGGFKHVLFVWVFKMPLWQWLILASTSGIISAWTLYLSVQMGVNSVLTYQKYLSQKCLKLVSDDKYIHWSKEFEQPPRQVLLRILRQGIQLTGLVSRRITRAFVSLLTFMMAFVVLLYLDGNLLLLLLPLSFLYIIALYYINRYAARVSTEMADTLPLSSSRFGHLVGQVLNKSMHVNTSEFQHAFDESLYMHQAELKYKRRLAEIHVNWLNTIFLVFGIAIIIIYIVYIQSTNIDWQQLLFFLIALRYAATSLQQISATTVAYSRFLPEIQLVFRLLNVRNLINNDEKLELNNHTIIYVSSSCIDEFELQQLNNSLVFKDSSMIKYIQEIREQGVNLFFEKLVHQPNQNLIIDNNLERLKRIVLNHKQKIAPVIEDVIVFSSVPTEIKQLSLDEFQNYELQDNCSDNVDDIDAFI